MKLQLDINEQNTLFAALSQLDSYTSETPGVENGPKTVRVPYKLGASRKALVRNMAALQASLTQFEEAHKALFKESFPKVPEGGTATKEAYPDEFPIYQAAQKKMIEEKDDIELWTFPESVLYPTDPKAREFPGDALLVLHNRGLIEYVADAAPQAPAAA
jgi:hypothetical protein